MLMRGKLKMTSRYFIQNRKVNGKNNYKRILTNKDMTITKLPDNKHVWSILRVIKDYNTKTFN